MGTDSSEPSARDEQPNAADPAASILNMRARMGEYSRRAESLLEERRSDNTLIDLGARYYERDRDAFATVLGSAIALRLFLFFASALAAFVGFVNLIGASSLIRSTLSATGTAGRVANDIETATMASKQAGFGIFLSSFILLLIYGRSLTWVLAGSAAGGWNLSAKEAKPTLRMAGTVAGLMVTMIVVTGVLGRIRQIGGLALTTGSFAALAGVVLIAWFIVMWSLPSRTPDPGAQLPGAAFFGIATALLQWFMQFYLPNKVNKSSATMGSIGLSVAYLGYFFIIGRLMASTFVINAVIWERYGSISEVVFGLPGLRRLPVRYQGVARFFRLELAAAPEAAPEAAPSTSDGPDENS